MFRFFLPFTLLDRKTTLIIIPSNAWYFEARKKTLFVMNLYYRILFFKLLYYVKKAYFCLFNNRNAKYL